MPLEMNCTDPSAKTTLTPPVCRLRAAFQAGALQDLEAQVVIGVP
jgi:hypothetical protein